MYADYLINSELIEEAYFLDGYALYDYQRWYPYMIKQSDSGVVGDIYRVNESTLADLHELEGIEELLFKFVYLKDHQFYTYLKYDENLEELKYIKKGDWLSYHQEITKNR